MAALIALLVFSARIHYLEIPPMGTITSIASSPRHLLLVNDHRLVFLNKNERYRIVYAYAPPEPPNLVGYDIEYGDFFAVGTENFYRINEFTYSVRSYSVPRARTIAGFAIGPGYIYWYDGTALMRVNKRSGKVETAAAVPPEARWFRRADAQALRAFPFLSPYYYEDSRFNRYPVTALAEDGMDLYVGTAGYGLFKYHRLTWEKSHITFSPYTSPVRRLLKQPGGLYFVGDFTVSWFDAAGDSFTNLRFDNRIDNLIPLQNKIYIGSANRLLSYEGNFVYPIAEPVENVRLFVQDGPDILYATRDGLYRLNVPANSVDYLGLEDAGINALLVDSTAIYAAGERGFFRYERSTTNWERLMNLPLLDALRFGDQYYFIAATRQLFVLSATTDTIMPLPYMNITCFDTDGQLVYLGTALGLAVYDPQRRTYRTAPYLPKEKINALALADDAIWLVTDRSILKMALAELR